MSDDVEYLKKYKPDHLYTHPGAKGAYATIAGESEEVGWAALIEDVAKPGEEVNNKVRR